MILNDFQQDCFRKRLDPGLKPLCKPPLLSQLASPWESTPAPQAPRGIGVGSLLSSRVESTHVGSCVVVYDDRTVQASLISHEVCC